MNKILSDSVGVGDNVILVSIGEDDEIVKIIGQTKRYFEIDLTTVKENHHTRMDFDCEREPETILLKTAKFVKTYVIYDGNDNKFDDLKSLYRYYDYHTGKLLPVMKLFDILNIIKNEIPFDYNLVFDKISKGEIRTSREMFNFLKTERTFIV
jgi:hypothetical protein